MQYLEAPEPDRPVLAASDTLAQGQAVAGRWQDPDDRQVPGPADGTAE